MNFKYLGKVPLCNHRADRGIYIYGFCLPLCARCTGLLIGSIAGTAAIRFVRISTAAKHFPDISPAACIGIGSALIAPTAVDGAREYFLKKESTNRRRMLTGLAAGTGCAVAENGAVKLLTNH